MSGNERLEPQTGDVTPQRGRYIANIVPSLLNDFSLVPKPPTGELKGFPSVSFGPIAECAREGAKLIDRFRSRSEAGAESTKAVVDGAVGVLKILGLESKTADILGTVMKKAIDVSKEVKSIGCSKTADGMPRMKIEFNKPITVGPVTLGEKGPLEFTMSPSVSKRGIEFADIKGARVGIGPLKTDLKSASLTLEDGEPKLNLNNTIKLPLSKLAKLLK